MMRGSFAILTGGGGGCHIPQLQEAGFLPETRALNFSLSCVSVGVGLAAVKMVRMRGRASYHRFNTETAEPCTSYHGSLRLRLQSLNHVYSQAAGVCPVPVPEKKISVTGLRFFERRPEAASILRHKRPCPSISLSVLGKAASTISRFIIL